MSNLEKSLMIIGFIALAIVLGIAFRAYLSPSMLLDLSALHICS